MSRLKILLLIALVSIMAFPAGLAQAQEATEDSVGTAVIWDDAAPSDAITYSLTGITAPAAGNVLVGWLVSDDDATKLNTGALTVAADGSVSHTFDSSAARYTGENLIATYNKVVITTEAEADAAAAGPAGPAVYNHVIPAAGLTHIRHLLTKWPSWRTAGSDTGILTDLKSQLDAAITHANLANNSTTLADVQTHTHHVINILEGATGANYDIAFGDPGDGVGAINHAINREHGPLASAAAADDAVIVAGAILVDIAGKNAEDWAKQARDIAVDQVLTSGTIDLAKLFVGPFADTVIGSLEAARNGFDSNGDGTIASVAGEGGAQQAYVEGQKMATFTLTAGAPPPAATPAATPTATPAATPTATPAAIEPGIDLPSVGDSSIPLLAQVALIASLVALAAGGVLLVRTRRSLTRA